VTVGPNSVAQAFVACMNRECSFPTLVAGTGRRDGSPQVSKRVYEFPTEAARARPANRTDSRNDGNQVLFDFFNSFTGNH